MIGIIKKFYEDLWSKGDLDVADEIIHPEYDPDWVQIPKKGPEQIKHEVKYFRSVFSEVTYRIEKHAQNEHEVWVLYSMSGLHDGNPWGFEATGKRFETQGTGIFTIKDGKIIDRTGVFCMYDVFNSLGLIPAWFEFSKYTITEKSS